MKRNNIESKENYKSKGKKNLKPRDKEVKESRRFSEQRKQPRERISVGDSMLVIGRNPVMEALRSGRKIEKIFIAENSGGSIYDVEKFAAERRVKVAYVSKYELRELSGGDNHQGVVAIAPPYQYAQLEDILRAADISEEKPFIIILDGIEDPHNLGAIIRTAECVGANGVIISKNRSAGVTSVVGKTSAGAIETVPIARVTNIGRTIDELKDRGVWVAACDMYGDDCFLSKNLDGAVAIVIGNEGKGVSRLVKEKCDFVVSIPMRGKINSLNASNAAAVVMYEVRRRREQVKI